jgi:hypothetical protein
MVWTAAVVFAAAAVLVVAGVGKVARPAGTAAALRAAGLPGTPLLAQLLGGVEIVIGVASLVWGNVVTNAALAAIYAGFAAFAALLLAAQGRSASCGCFGERHTSVHPLHIVVNLAIACIAATGVASPAGGLGELGNHSTADVVAFLALTAAVAVLIYVLIAIVPDRLAARSVARASARATRTGSGTALVGKRLDGRPAAVPLDARPAGTVLAFLSSSCLGCRPFWEDLAANGLPGVLPPGAGFVIVPKDAAEEDQAALARLAPRAVELVQSSDAWTAFGVPGSPFFVLVDGVTGRARARDTATNWAEVADRLGLSTPAPTAPD